MSNLKSGVYEIANTVSGRRYIGSAVNVMSRRSQHRRELAKGTHALPQGRCYE